MKTMKLGLLPRILIAIVLGIFAGMVSPAFPVNAFLSPSTGCSVSSLILSFR